MMEIYGYLHHALVDALQLDEDQRRVVPHVLDLLVDEVLIPALSHCVGRRRAQDVLLEYLFEFILESRE